MAKLNAKLYIKAVGEAAVACDLYSTIEEVGGEYVTVTASGIKAYAKLGGTSDAFSTKGRVKKGINIYAVLSQAKPPYNKVEYRTPGTYTFTVPAGVDTVRATVAGAGGGGGGCTRLAKSTGGNGGSGALIMQTITNVQRTLVVIVGQGGGAGSNGGGGEGSTSVGGNGGNGGVSSIENVVTAQGGGGGTGAYYRPNQESWNGTNGASYDAGGAGGAGAINDAQNTKAGSGANGWVVIEYGGDI